LDRVRILDIAAGYVFRDIEKRFSGLLRDGRCGLACSVFNSFSRDRTGRRPECRLAKREWRDITSEVDGILRRNLFVISSWDLNRGIAHPESDRIVAGAWRIPLDRVNPVFSRDRVLSGLQHSGDFSSTGS